MAHDSTLDPVSILAALDVSDADSVTPVHGGMDTTLWRVVCGTQIYALRVFRSRQAEVVHREIAAMRAARSASLPVPTLHGQTVWEGRPALLLGWMPGDTIGQIVRRQPWRAWQLGRAFGEMQARIHAVAAPDLQAQPSADWIGWLGEDEPALQAALRSHAQPACCLLHLDYHPLNVLANGPSITGVLDWANARAGDPRADLARTYAILRVEPYGPARDALGLSLLRRLLAHRWLAGYQAIAGVPTEMALFFAWAGALMMRDLAPRIADPHSWWQPNHLEPIQRWTQQWKRRAGLDGS